MQDEELAAPARTGRLLAPPRRRSRGRSLRDRGRPLLAPSRRRARDRPAGARRDLEGNRARQRSVLQPRRVLVGDATGYRAGGRRRDHGRISMPTAPSRRSFVRECGEPRLRRRSSRTGSDGRSSSRARERGAGEGADRPLLLRLRQVSRARQRGERNRRTPGRSGHPLLRLRRAGPEGVRRRRLRGSGRMASTAPLARRGDRRPGPPGGHLRERDRPGGQLRGVRRSAAPTRRSNEEVTRGLSPHHRLHGVSASLELEELLGNWEAASRLQPRRGSGGRRKRRDAVRTKPALSARVRACSRVPRRRRGGQATRARGGGPRDERLRDRARHAAPATRPSSRRPCSRRVLARRAGGPAVRTGSTSARWRPTWTGSRRSASARGWSARQPGHVKPETYLEPFALRALGIVREDGSLVERAADRFAALGLDWHAARTRELL